MNRLLFFSAGFSLIFAVSCSSSSNDNNTQTRIINIPTYKVEDRNAQDCRKLFSDAKRVSLKSTDKNTTLANIGSIKFERDALRLLAAAQLTLDAASGGFAVCCADLFFLELKTTESFFIQWAKSEICQIKRTSHIPTFHFMPFISFRVQKKRPSQISFY